MIVDVHTHFFDPRTAFGDSLKEDMRECGIDPEAWAFTPDLVDLAERHHFRLRQGGTDLTVHEPSQTDPLAIVRDMADQEGVDAA